MSTTDQLMRLTPDMLAQVRDANNPDYRGRHRTTEEVATRVIRPDVVARARQEMRAEQPASLLGRALRAVRR